MFPVLIVINELHITGCRYRIASLQIVLLAHVQGGLNQAMAVHNGSSAASATDPA